MIKDDLSGGDEILYTMVILDDGNLKLSPLKSLSNLGMEYLSLKLGIQDHSKVVILGKNLIPLVK